MDSLLAEVQSGAEVLLLLMLLLLLLLQLLLSLLLLLLLLLLLPQALQHLSHQADVLVANLKASCCFCCC